MYILEPETLDLLPNNEFYHITELIELLIVKNGRVGVFPIAEKSWHDIGNWNDYNQLLNKKF